MFKTQTHTPPWKKRAVVANHTSSALIQVPPPVKHQTEKHICFWPSISNRWCRHFIFVFFKAWLYDDCSDSHTNVFNFLFESCYTPAPRPPTPFPNASSFKPQGLEPRSRAKMILVLKIVFIIALRQKLLAEEMEIGNLGWKKMESVK